MIFGLTGEKLAGKGTAAEYLRQKYEAKKYRFSQIIDDLLARLYLPNSRDNEITIIQALREKFGIEILAHVLKKDIEKDQPKLGVIDGIRFWEEVRILKTLPDFVLVYLSAPLEQRFDRCLKRGEKADDSTMTLDKFKATETAPTERFIPEIGATAQEKIDNNGTLEEFYQKIDQLCQKYCLK